MKILVISSNNTYAPQKLAKEAIKAKIELVFKRANELKGLSPKDFDVLYVRNPFVNAGAKYLPEVVKLAKAFKRGGKKVVDNIIANGNLAQGKRKDYQQLLKAALPIPKTKPYQSKPYTLNPYPFVLKWQYGMKGKDVFLVDEEIQLKKILGLHPKKEWLVQEFVKADYEYKIITVGYKALPTILRFKMNYSGFRVDFESARSVPIYGRLGLPINRHATLVNIAEKASKLLGRELAKVDILEAKGKFYILEVNRFPGLEWFEKLTGHNVTKDFLKYLSNKKR